MASVLTFSNTIRERQLQTNLGLYHGYDFKSDNISYYSFHTKPLHSLTGGGTLYEYTHNEKTDYSKQIGHLYFKHRDDFQPYINTDPMNPQNFWGGEYHDYYDYVNTVYGQITPPVRFIEGLISTQFLDEAIRVTSPAVVHNPEPTLSLNGAIKTNVNNFSGTDTRTGLLGNQMYAHALYHGANFNTMRKNTTSFINNSITPSVGVRFGNSDYTINSLSNIVSALRDDGRIVEDYNQGIGIIDDVEHIITFENAYNTTYESYNKELDDYDKKLKAYEKNLKEYRKDKNRNKENKPTKPKKPAEPFVFFTDLNPTNLFKTLELNNYFDKNTKKFKPYAGTKWDNGETFIEKNIYNFNGKGKINGKTQHVVYDDNDRGFRNIEVSTEFDEYKSYVDEEWIETTYQIANQGLNIINGNADAKVGHMPTYLSSDSLLKKTKKLFKEKRINNLGFGGFVDDRYENTFTDTSTSSSGKRSRSRNLEKKNKDIINGYDNPFCRTWTYHHQYDKIDRLIRPFSNEEGKIMTVGEVQDFNAKYRAFDSRIGGTQFGGRYLSENSVLNDETGIVNISPSNEGKVDIKKCMFSIENLAWKDVLNKEEYLSKEQRGPNGGRIMWFPPYDLNFSENTNANWESNTFIGRGEKIYTYSNTDRTGSLSFTLLIDHPSIINNVNDNKTSISNDDILRFFAGCNPMTGIQFKTKEGGEITTQTTGGTDENTTTTNDKPKTEEKEIKIFVYFPNNYSGHFKNAILSQQKNTTTSPDEDFLEYMINGFCAYYGEDLSKEGRRGYERCDSGISDILIFETNEMGVISDKDGFIEDGFAIYRCEPNSNVYQECQNLYKPLIESNDKYQELYYYRVDADLRQNLKTLSNYEDTKSFKLNSENGEGDYQFIELAYVLAKILNKTSVIETLENEEKIKNSKLINILTAENLSNITKIIFKGGASSQDKTNSEMLAIRRCATLQHLFKQAFPNFSNYEIGVNTVSGNGESINTEDIKKNRYACVTIKYKVSKDEVLEEGAKSAQQENEDKGKKTQTVTYEWNRYENEGEYFRKLKTNSPTTFKKLTDKYKYFTPAFHSVSPEGFNARLTFLQQCTRQGHTIEPKISTNNLDKPTEVAGNLAFGRMPVCVLRIGDFIYSRIIITSMNINYGDNQWDLNPEGAGVQPMMAKVSLGITILGGQSLEGPISKLQNAVTFNYYANAGVYDNRADRAKPVENDNKWSTDYYYTWEPKEWKPKTETQTTTNQTTNS